MGQASRSPSHGACSYPAPVATSGCTKETVTAGAYTDAVAARLYDVAFSWPRVREADFAEACLQSFGRRTEGTVLDLACGGGHFLLEMQQRGWRVAGVDISPQMLGLAHARLAKAPVLEAECMSCFQLTGPFDLVTCWSDSLTYLLSNDEIIRHLRAVAGVLSDKGVYLVDVGFGRWSDSMWCQPPEAWTPDFSHGWSVPSGETEVYHDGCDGPPCNGLSHLYTEYLHFRITDRASGLIREHTYTAWKRALHPQEFAALVSASAVFEVAAWFTGDMDLSQTLESADGRGRGLALLRKRPG